MPKISVIVPVYNVEKYIDRCMESLLNQTLRDIEIILVDDGSLDSSGIRCDYYGDKDKRVRVVHKKNEGLGKARNSGLDIATGEFISFIDSDDFIERDMLERLYVEAKDNNADTCYCSYSKYLSNSSSVNSCEGIKEKKLFKGDNTKEKFLPLMLGALPDYKNDFEISMCVWRAIYSKKIIDSKNIRFCSEREFISEDIIFHIDYIYHSKCIIYIPYIGYHYCQNGESLTGKYKEDRFSYDVNLYLEICNRLNNKQLLDKNKVRVDRLLIGRSRTAIKQELSRECSVSEKNSNIKKIINNTVLQNIIREYKIFRMPIKHMVYALALKYKSIGMIKILMFKN